MPNRLASLVVGSGERGGPILERSAMERDRVHLRLATAVWLAQQDSWDSVWIVTETADGLGGAAIEDALGGDRLQSLRAGGSVSFKGQSIRHALQSTLQERGVSGSVLALYPTPGVLDALDTLDRPNAVVVVPGAHGIQAWIDTWGPQHLLTGELHSRLEIIDPEVLGVVNDLLTDMTEDVQRLDPTRAQLPFSALRQSGRTVDLRAIRARVRRAIGEGIIRLTPSL